MLFSLLWRHNPFWTIRLTSSTCEGSLWNSSIFISHKPGPLKLSNSMAFRYGLSQSVRFEDLIVINNCIVCALILPVTLGADNAVDLPNRIRLFWLGDSRKRRPQDRRERCLRRCIRSIRTIQVDYKSTSIWHTAYLNFSSKALMLIYLMNFKAHKQKREYQIERFPAIVFEGDSKAFRTADGHQLIQHNVHRRS